MKSDYDIFISYRRKGGFETAKHLYDLLSRDGYRVSFDIDSLRDGNFDESIFKIIDGCKDFILIVDEHAFDRTINGLDRKDDWLRQELAYAIKRDLNIIPILLNGVKEFPTKLPYDIVEVKRKNGPEYSSYYFDDFYKKLKDQFIKSKSKKGDKSTLRILSPILALLAGVIVIFFFILNHKQSAIDTNITETDSIETTNKNVKDLEWLTEYGKASYTGSTDNDRIPNGYGEVYFLEGSLNGSFYKGEVKKGVLDGEVEEYITIQNGDKYRFEGVFKNNHYSEGVLLRVSGSRGVGQYFKGKFNDSGEPSEGYYYDINNCIIDSVGH